MADVSQEYDISTPFWKDYYRKCNKDARVIRRELNEMEAIIYLIRSKWIICDPRRLAFEKFLTKEDNLWAMDELCKMMKGEETNKKIEAVIEYLRETGYLKKLE